ncbi:MAG: cell division protein SepF [Armatimonadetes bacterium]|nr:cell division protein SepF [Armatimonadota bacterium]
MSHDFTQGHPLPSAWWGELKRILRLRPEPPPEESHEGLSALFVRKREVRPAEIRTCTVRSADHVTHAANRLRSRQPVIINLEEMPAEDRGRALDFLSGVAYGLDGSYESVAAWVFLLVPGSVEIVDEE